MLLLVLLRTTNKSPFRKTSSPKSVSIVTRIRRSAFGVRRSAFGIRAFEQRPITRIATELASFENIVPLLVLDSRYSPRGRRFCGSNGDSAITRAARRSISTETVSSVPGLAIATGR